MMQTPYPSSHDGIPQSLPGHDIASYPIIHHDAVDATFVACDPLHKDAVLARYSALGWTVENVDEEDVQDVQARRAMHLLLEAWNAADRSGNTDLAEKIGGLYHDLDRAPRF